MDVSCVVIDKDKDGKVNQEKMDVVLKKIQKGNKAIEIEHVTNTPKQVLIIYRFMGVGMDF